MNNETEPCKKILVVDDDVDIVHIVKIILEKHGFEVIPHDRSLGVIEKIVTHSPNLILLDIMLPDKLGTEVCKESIPIIFFSAHAKEGEAYKECEADGFIQKPFEVQLLVDTIKFHLN